MRGGCVRRLLELRTANADADISRLLVHEFEIQGRHRKQGGYLPIVPSVSMAPRWRLPRTETAMTGALDPVFSERAGSKESW